ncbi:MAG: oligosaccharide flippase family protein [Clostridia bacterium]|nr:oligosaccharide flippase family protein [Clostridia bacterium]
MIQKTIFIKNAAILTVSSLLLRFIGIIFKVWLASRIGSEGIGLYQLVFSVYMLAATFATSGICTAVTRLVADELALGSKRGVAKIFRRCVEITLLIAFLSTLILVFGAKVIAKYFLSDMRAVPAIKILSLSLPFMGLSSCFRGYFIARRKASPTALSQLFEQVVRIVIVLLLVGKYAHKGLAFTCGAVLLGDTVAELASAVYLALLYLFDKRKLKNLSGRARPPFKIVKAVAHIAVPITLGRYLNTALRTAENILVPKCLSKNRTTGQNALSQFGMIKGMALPILFFPSTLLNSLSTLLIPEMSEAAARGRKGLVRDAVGGILRITALISFIFAAVFMTAGKEIGMLIYKSNDVGFLLCMLAPIVPLMYLDSVSDGILKGLDQQAFTFRTSVIDSAIRIVLVIIILPRFGLNGFIGIMYFSNLLTCGLNVGRLIKVSEAEFDAVKTVFIPLVGAIVITLLFDTLISMIHGLPNLVYITLLCVTSIPSYIAFLFMLGSVSTDDIRNYVR